MEQRLLDAVPFSFVEDKLPAVCEGLIRVVGREHFTVIVPTEFLPAYSYDYHLLPPVAACRAFHLLITCPKSGLSFA